MIESINSFVSWITDSTEISVYKYFKTKTTVFYK